MMNLKTFVYGYSFFNIEQFISYKTIGLIIIILAINCAINAFFCYLNNRRFKQRLMENQQSFLDDWEETNEDDFE